MRNKDEKFNKLLTNRTQKRCQEQTKTSLKLKTPVTCNSQRWNRNLSKIQTPHYTQAASPASFFIPTKPSQATSLKESDKAWLSNRQKRKSQNKIPQSKRIWEKVPKRLPVLTVSWWMHLKLQRMKEWKKLIWEINKPHFLALSLNHQPSTKKSCCASRPLANSSQTCS